MKPNRCIPWERETPRKTEPWSGVAWTANISFIVIASVVLGGIWLIGETWGLSGLLWVLAAQMAIAVAWRIVTGRWPD